MACGNNHVSRGYLSSQPVAASAATPTFLQPARAPGKPPRQILGERGEALVARLLMEAKGHSMVYQHTPGERPQGVDLVTLDPDGRLVVTEVKATAADRYSRPHTTQNVSDHQLDAAWTSKNLSQTGAVSVGPEAVGFAADQVSVQLAQFDALSRTISFWEITADGRRAGSIPLEVWDASDFGDGG